MRSKSPMTMLGRTILSLALGLALIGAKAQEQNHSDNSKPVLSNTAPLSKDAKQDVLREINKIMESEAYVPKADFSKWPEFLDKQKDAIDKASTPRDFALAINTAFESFGVSHIVLATPDAVNARLTHQSVGIGIQLEPDPDGLKIINVFEGSAAAEAGLVPGDLIIEGNGKKATNPADLQGDVGSTLQIKVKRASGEVKEFKLIRRKFSNVRPETLTWQSPDTAVIKIPTFDIAYNAKRVDELMTKANKAKNLIVDLRSNGGGRVLNLLEFLGTILPDGTQMGTFISRGVVDGYKKETGQSVDDLAAVANWAQKDPHWSRNRLTIHNGDTPVFTGHVAVLVNGGSGSASEMAAAALKECDNAIIVGTKSAGAVLVSVMNPLPSNFMLQCPIMDYVTKNGVRLEGTGVSPSIEVKSIPKFGDKDEAIEKAAVALKNIVN